MRARVSQPGEPHELEYLADGFPDGLKTKPSLVDDEACFRMKKAAELRSSRVWREESESESRSPSTTQTVVGRMLFSVSAVKEG